MERQKDGVGAHRGIAAHDGRCAATAADHLHRISIGKPCPRGHIRMHLREHRASGLS
jgi:hypothetical protein